MTDPTTCTKVTAQVDTALLFDKWPSNAW